MIGCATHRMRKTAGTVYGLDARPEEDFRAADPEFVEELGDEIATLSAHIHAATHRLLVLIAEFDRLRGWELTGYPNCARWLAARTGIDLGAAREKVRAARALEDLPLISGAMSRGELSFSQVRALSRVARRETEADLLALARGTTTAQLERMIRAWKEGSRADEAERERELHASRTFSVFPVNDGMYVVTGRLMPEVGALLMRAIEAAGDALYRERRLADAGTDREREAARLRADAVGLMAECALAAGFGGSDPGCGMAGTRISGTRAERYQVVLHVEAQTLSANDESGRSDLEDGTRLAPETARRLACDASVVRVTHSAARARIPPETSGRTGGVDSATAATRISAATSAAAACVPRVARHDPNADAPVLDVGRRTRTISPALRRALEARDRGCRFPGCSLRFTDAHHLKHWADGGETSLSNCLLLCAWHHRLVHEGGWRVEWWGEGRPLFIDPRGGEHFDGRWQPPRLPERPVESLVHDHTLRGIAPETWMASERWERERDIPASVYFPALEAL